MENRQRVFVHGVEGRGDEVRQALVNLGGKNVHDFCYGDTEGLFFINHNGEIRYTSEFSEMGKIIMDCYTEFHLPDKWKDGDILFSEAYNEFAVFEEEYKIDSDKFLSYLATCFKGYLTFQAIRRGDFRLATKLEVAQFHERLHAINKEWDVEKNQLIDWRWKPKKKDGYYLIDNDGDIMYDTWDGCNVDADRYNFGNCFRTKEEAEAMAEKIKKLLKGEGL